MGTVKDVYDIALDLLSKLRKKQIEEVTPATLPELTERGSSGITWEQYEKLYDIGGYVVSYLPIINHWKGEITHLNQDQVQIKRTDGKFSLPSEFAGATIPPDAYDGCCCRLSNYSINANNILKIEFQETSYFDYLRSGEQLDAPFPTNPSINNREAFGKIFEKGGQLWPFTLLTNICGVGLFLRTNDNKLIINVVSPSSHVYPERKTFSASGVMKWDEEINPFTAVRTKCIEKILHKSDINNVNLVSFGVDARKLYFQFSFLEKTNKTSDEILKKLKSSSISVIPFELGKIVNQLFEYCWEPSAEATLLTLCFDEFGIEQTCRSLFSQNALWDRREMRDEWDYRASRPGDLPDMSLRYKRENIIRESRKYVEAVIEFLRAKASGADVVEVGCGTGRITEQLAEIAGSLTCVEFCEKMVKRNKKRFENKSKLPQYAIAFGQDYFPRPRHDVAVCSLVLIHNVNDADYRQLVKSLCRMARNIFVFEDISSGRKTSPRTKIRNVGTIVETFNEFGFELKNGNTNTYRLFNDDISFFEFNEVIFAEQANSAAAKSRAAD